MTPVFIPKKIKVGFQNRSDTYTGKLAFVTYYDEKGVLRKEKSWNGWRNPKIEPIEFDNIPVEGFVLNRPVGGYKSDWNFRQSYIRVYDPRGFEFEISLQNLLLILNESNSIKGKGLEGEFIYSWNGTELLLLPVGSEMHTASCKKTELINAKFSLKDLKVGSTYEDVSRNQYIYLGRFDRYILNKYVKKGILWSPCNWFGSDRDDREIKIEYNQKKEHVFADEKGNIHFKVPVKSLITDLVPPNFAELVEKYTTSADASYPEEIVYRDLSRARKEPYYYTYVSNLKKTHIGSYSYSYWGDPRRFTPHYKFTSNLYKTDKGSALELVKFGYYSLYSYPGSPDVMEYEMEYEVVFKMKNGAIKEINL